MGCTGTVVKIPIACTLTTEDAAVRVEEWRAFFTTHTHEVRALSATEMAVRLGDDDASLLAAADLARREQSCCNFFSFAIEIAPAARWLRVSVPADAAPVLEDFSALATAALEARAV